ncbi:MAG TPA: UDP-N-acetylmuramoyl-tripeptide--D-alanyl-D-alanine ligase [Candidatus Saccharimonadales bacterium]|nr:UDP-N-acetylmuramoyl-tripeptide--D-alanyl-D-alanine ligase [Candidatus Saccharimonadales bacterium]
MKLPLGRVADFIKGHGTFDRQAVAEGYSIDTRTIKPGALFFAIRGERLDGHDYVEQALGAGAVAAVVAQNQLSRFADQGKLIAVEDSTLALQKLGAAVRRLWGRKLIGVTGSAGKTTTKECIAHVLGAHFQVLKSLGNLNNHFGLPMQLLRLEAQHDIAVIEMGMSHSGEITHLAEIAAPDQGVVTNVGLAHLESFGTQAGIARAKYELIESLPAGGHAFLNADDPYACQFGRDFHGKVTLYGIQHPSDYRAENVELRGVLGSKFDIVGPGFRESATVPLIGRHNVLNALVGVAVAAENGVKPSDAAARLASLTAGDKRGEVREAFGAILINDCYNSNPLALDSMVAALSQTPAKRRIAIAGEMLELGPTSPELHRACGRNMALNKVDYVVGVRGNGESIAEGAAAAGVASEFVETPEEAGEWLARNLREGDAVLLKGSRGVGLERALTVFEAQRKV